MADTMDAVLSLADTTEVIRIAGITGGGIATMVVQALRRGTQRHD